MKDPLVSFLVLDFLKESESRACLQSIRDHVKIPHKVVYLDNGSGVEIDYPTGIYKDGLCDVLIRKRYGQGGGHGQTDLFRWCDTSMAIFVQNDQELLYDIDEKVFKNLVWPLSNGYHCVDLNGDQSRKGIWTDRAHLIDTSFFNSLGPFPNGGPGNDAEPWNEAYLQRIFEERNYRIAHFQPAIFADSGKWSVREAADGLFKHRCDLKTLYVLRVPTYRSSVYPPLNDAEWERVLDGKWTNGDIPEAWKQHSFTHWP